MTNRFQEYFGLIKKAAESEIFDIIAHFDLPRRYWGNLGENEIEMANDALRAIKASDMCIELNTSGFRTNNVLECFPGKKLLKYAKEVDIPVTLGSDSHQPEHVATYFTEAIQLLKEVGYSDVSLFEKRRRKPVSII